jgi:hypothetical protein
MTIYARRQRQLFATAPTVPAKPPRARTISNPPALPRATGWLKAFLLPEVWQRIERPPEIVYSPRRKRV